MKVLFIAENHRNFNDMHTNLWYSLAEVMDVVYYGPGFTSKEDLDNGVKAFIERNGGFDVIFITHGLLLFDIERFSSHEIYFENQYNNMDFYMNQALRVVPSILRDLKEINIARVLLFTDDMPTLTEEMNLEIRELLASGFYLCSAGIQFAPEIQKESTVGSIRYTNHYYEIANEYQSRVIAQTSASVSVTEYYFKPLSLREYDWSVPGAIAVQYPQRMQILEKLKKQNYKLFDAYSNRGFGYVNNRKHKSIYSRSHYSEEAIAAWRTEYHLALCNTKICYADGGNAHVIVRKFFEIPARGALLACEHTLGLKEMGFQDGVNMVEVTPENIIEKSAELFKNPERMQEIASAGQRLVIQNHTFRKRAECIKRALEVIIAGSFHGSYWEDGKFVIEKTDGDREFL